MRWILDNKRKYPEYRVCHMFWASQKLVYQRFCKNQGFTTIKQVVYWKFFLMLSFNEIVVAHMENKKIYPAIIFKPKTWLKLVATLSTLHKMMSRFLNGKHQHILLKLNESVIFQVWDYGEENLIFIPCQKDKKIELPTQQSGHIARPHKPGHKVSNFSFGSLNWNKTCNGAISAILCYWT